MVGLGKLRNNSLDDCVKLTKLVSSFAFPRDGVF